jgi:endonuclease/exonuclease/phosphatase family metal-dependent hydrolase
VTRADALFCDVLYARAPDPTAHLHAVHQAHQAQVPGDVPFSVTSYNVALLPEFTAADLPVLRFLSEFPLTAWLFFWLDWITVQEPSPRRQERKPHIIAALKAARSDVLLLQEVWNPDDAQWIAAQMAPDYVAVISPREDHSDGLMTLVRRAIVNGEQPIQTFAKPYEHQVWKEGLVRIQRGYQQIRFVHKEAGAITLLNTHLRAYPDGWAGRLEQAREIGLAASAVDARELVVLGGDLNSGPYYPQNHYGVGADWWRNAGAYGAIEHYSGLADGALLGSDAPLADVQRPTVADERAAWPYSASDRSNRLYRQQYAGQEYEARLDYVRVRATHGKVTGASFIGTDRVTLQDGAEVEPSDHYGQKIEMMLNRQKFAARGG